MKVSIVTIVKDDPSGLEKTIQSVRSQTFKTIEHIIVDGGSSEETLKVIDKLRNDMTIFIPGPDKGRYDGMNRGIELSTGGVIGLLHAGDIYCNDSVISDVADKFNDPQTEAVYGDVEFFKKDSGKIIRKWIAGEFDRKKIISQGWVPPHLSLFVKKELFNKYGYYRLDMPIAADHEWMLRLFLDSNANIKYIPATLVMMCHGGESTRSLKNIIKSNIQVAQARKIHNLPTTMFTFVKKILWKIGQLFFK